MNAAQPPGEPHDSGEKPIEITTFYPQEVEVLDPLRQTVAGSYYPRRSVRSNGRVALLLFAATCVSVFLAGLIPGVPLGSLTNVQVLVSKLEQGSLGNEWIGMIQDGAIYFGAVMTILIAHEMGHYLQARRHRVPATLPYFIPFPISPFGTMGAVIVQSAGVADRKKLFDIAISGPLAGLVFALPIAVIGIRTSTVAYIDPAKGSLQYGDPLLLQWLARWIHGPIPEHYDLTLNAWLFAGWVGIFITALNLMPIGQLDGGHILYTLIGPRAHRIALLLLAVALSFMIFAQELGYALMVLLLFVAGPRHPPTADDSVPLGTPRIVLGWLTLCFVVIGFTPIPIKILQPQAPSQQQIQPQRQQEEPHSSSDALEVRLPAHKERAVSAVHEAQRVFMNRSASRDRCSSEENIRRQILVAAARSGSASPKASTISQPSYLTSLSVLKVVSQST